jgi:hypothetical protein
MHVLVLKCGITGRTSSKDSFHTYFWHFSMQKPDKAVRPDKDTTYHNKHYPFTPPHPHPKITCVKDSANLINEEKKKQQQ